MSNLHTQRFTMKKFENKVWLSTPTMHGEELKYVKEAYDTNWMSTIGENINEIEKQMSEKVGCKYAVALSCGTSALHMAVKLAGVASKDKVFCSDMTFAATVNPVVYEKAESVFIDTEYESWNMDPKCLEKAFSIYPNVKTVVVANLYGTPAKLSEICEVAQKHGACVIEDAAESLGATYNGKQTGSFGKYNIISFNGNKIITGSSGGMLLTDDEQAAAKVRKWSTQSRESAPWYQHEELGYNYRITDFQAALGISQLKRLDWSIERRNEIAKKYDEAIEAYAEMLNLAQKLRKPRETFWALLKLGTIWKLKGNDGIALEYLLNASTFAHDNKMPIDCAIADSIRASIFSSIGCLNEVSELLKNSGKIFESL